MRPIYGWLLAIFWDYYYPPGLSQLVVIGLEVDWQGKSPHGQVVWTFCIDLWLFLEHDVYCFQLFELTCYSRNLCETFFFVWFKKLFYCKNSDDRWECALPLNHSAIQWLNMKQHPYITPVLIGLFMYPPVADIDECAQRSHNCGVGSECVNTQGSFRCVSKPRCPVGFTQDAQGSCMGKQTCNHFWCIWAKIIHLRRENTGSCMLHFLLNCIYFTIQLNPPLICYYWGKNWPVSADVHIFNPAIIFFCF